MGSIDQVTQKTSNIEILIGPENRVDYLNGVLKMDGLLGLPEDPKATYCGLSLTNTPATAKPFVAQRQFILRKILSAAGLTSYDPGTAPGSPDLGLTIGPDEIYKTDIARVAGARFFTAFDTFPSTGIGVEIEAARRYNRIAVILHDNPIRTSRMQPDCAIHVNITLLEDQKDSLKKMFELLQQYEPGRGLKEGKPVLLGFKDDRPHDLAEVVREQFPELTYTYDGEKPPLTFALENPQVLFDASKN